jgi:hypothetical protein
LINAAGGLNGAFATVTMPQDLLNRPMGVYTSAGDGNGLVQDANKVTITLDYDLNPADSNMDGVTDGGDRIDWSDNKFTFGKGWGGADWNHDGATDGGDLIVWNTNKFTKTPGLPGGSPQSVADDVMAAAAAAVTFPDPGPPFVEYNPATGEMRVESEHYLMSILIEGPPPLLWPELGDGDYPHHVYLPDGGKNDRDERIGWTQDYFNGRLNLIEGKDKGLVITDAAILGEWPGELRPAHPEIPNGLLEYSDLVIALYAMGLGAEDFGQGEVGQQLGAVQWNATVWDETGTVATVVSGFTDVTIVPEPATMGLLVLGGLGVLARRRRRRA